MRARTVSAGGPALLALVAACRAGGAPPRVPAAPPATPEPAYACPPGAPPGSPRPVAARAPFGVASIAWRPDGALFLTTSSAGALAAWDARTGAPRGTLDAKMGVRGVAFAPDGRRFATHDDRTVLLWDAAAGDAHELALPAQRGIAWLDWSPSGTALAVVGFDQTRLVAPDGGDVGDPIDAQFGGFTARGEAFLTLRRFTGAFGVWDAEPRRRRFETGDGVPCLDVQLSPGGDWVAELQGRAEIVFFDPATGARTFDVPTRERAWRLVRTGRADRLLALEDSGAVELVDVAARRAVADVGPAAAGRVEARADAIVVATPDGGARVFDAGTGAPRATMDGAEPAGLAMVSLAPDGRTVVAATRREGLRVWDAVTGAERARYERPAKASVRAIAWSPDGATLAAVQGERLIAWSATTGAVVGSFATDEGATPTAFVPPFGLAFTADGAHLVAEDAAGTDVRDARTLASTLRVPSSAGKMALLARAPVGAAVARAAAGGVELVDLESGGARRTLGPLAGEPTSAAFSHDGRSVAVGLERGELAIFDTATGARVRAFRALLGERVVGFGAGDRTLVTAWAGRLRALDVATFAPVLTLDVHDAHAAAPLAAVSDDGTRVAAVRGARVIVWHLGQEAPLAALELDGRDPPTALAFAPGGGLLAAGGDALHVLRVADGAAVRLDAVDVPGAARPAGLAYAPTGLFGGDDGAASALWLVFGSPASSGKVLAADGEAGASLRRDRLLADLAAGCPLRQPDFAPSDNPCQLDRHHISE